MIIIGCGYFYMSLSLPNVDALKNMQLQIPLRVYTSDNKLIAIYGEKRRVPVKLHDVPPQLINAILDTEDKRFYEHPGVDFIGLARATIQLIETGKKSQGASTITMQVARNFFLTRKKTYHRKINEIMLALKMSHDLTKDKVLELYVNKIYLGQRAYGVAAAAQIYYGKPLNQLDLAQMAMMAGLPQSPSRDNPITNPKGALDRRQHVLQRMLEAKHITQEQYDQANSQPVTASFHGLTVNTSAPYVGEMVRQAMMVEFGQNAYTDGYRVYTTLDSSLQQEANKDLKNGLEAYDRRHGYRGPEQKWGAPSPEKISQEWPIKLNNLPTVNGMLPAVITSETDNTITALIGNNQEITINWDGMSWARPMIDTKTRGAAPKISSDIAKPGDLIRIRKATNGNWQLTQIPAIQGALVALAPNDGSIVALTGGYSYVISHFNRATQALRQPGSNFKPFVYSAALAQGMTLASMINDAPVVLEDTGENQLWRPQNDTEKFYGPTSLRVGLMKSRNLVSIRLLQTIGIPYALKYISRFGFDPYTLPNTLSLALGSASLTPLQIISGYSVFANGGYEVKPYFIKKILNENNDTVYEIKPQTACETTNCQPTDTTTIAPQTITPANAYLMTSAMQDVIKRGTGRKALVLKRSDLAGKTGTTNNQMDAWFSGFNSDIATTVWVGFDTPISLNEYGAQSALPIWINFMGYALKGKPEHTMNRPNDIVTIKIDPKNGLLAAPGQQNAQFEQFRKQYAPTEQSTATPTNDPYQTNNSNNNTEQIF